MNQAGLMFKV